MSQSTIKLTPLFKLDTLSKIDQESLSIRGASGFFKPENDKELALCTKARKEGATGMLEWWRIEDHPPAIEFRRYFEEVNRQNNAAALAEDNEPTQENIVALTQKLAMELPATGGYEKGYRDALESIALALAQKVDLPVLNDAVTTALDAYANNAGEIENLVTLDLNVFDDGGDVVDGTTATLSVEQLSDIVDHASQLILMRRDGQALDNVLDELDEALTVSDVIDEPAGHKETNNG